MNNKFYNMPNDWYSEFNNTFNPLDNMNSNNTNNSNLVTPKEALQRGNLFNNLYDPYKGYKYRNLTPVNKKEEILFNLLKFKFAMKELDLYLDTHPFDNNMINLYREYLQEEKKLCQEYELSYGPLTLDSSTIKENKWDWISSPWPWEGTR